MNVDDRDLRRQIDLSETGTYESSKSWCCLPQSPDERLAGLCADPAGPTRIERCGPVGDFVGDELDDVVECGGDDTGVRR